MDDPKTHRANTKIFFLDLNEWKSQGDKAQWRWWDLYPKLGSGETPPNVEHIDVLRLSLLEKGPGYWNEWRKAHPSEKPQLSGIQFPTRIINGQGAGVRLRDLDLSEAEFRGVQLHFAGLQGVRLDRANIRESLIMQSVIENCSFVEANLTQTCLGSTKIGCSRFDSADMLRAHLMQVDTHACCFAKTCLDSANLSMSTFEGCKFESANLEESLCGSSKFINCDFSGANLQRASMVKTELTSCDLSQAHVYGINAWDVSISKDTNQANLALTAERDQNKITVDDLRVAQFIHLILNNSNIRQVIDTLGAKAVLILGRFAGDNKSTLEALRNALRRRGFIPIIFDFDRPTQKDFTETVATLAGLCLFVIADITSPKSVPLELDATVPNLMIPFVPILQEGEEPFSMFRDLWNKYDWVFEPLLYDNLENLVNVLDAAVIEPALKKHKLLVRRKARALGVRHVREFMTSRSGTEPEEPKSTIPPKLSKPRAKKLQLQPELS